jgi:aspartyl-tRNA(Asn)/glutamyl-tRNA(Gln) amidotransferase subunit A
MGASTENSAYGPTLNPHDLERVPGGSSGGSAAAIAAGLAVYSLGSDTGGSIRQPASFCGVVGLNPTYGRVSRYGVMAMAASLYQIGPITKTVEDSALVLNQIAGHDPRDSSSVQLSVPDYTAKLGQSIKGLRIGVPKEYFMEGLDPRVEAKIREAINVLEKLGAIIGEATLPHSEYVVATYYVIVPSEVSADMARYDGIRYGHVSPNANNLLEVYTKSRAEGFGDEVRRRIMVGTYALSAGYYDAYYLKAQKVRTLIRRDYENAFKDFDVLVGPTAPTPAFKIGEQSEDPLKMYLADIYTAGVKLAGLPAISIPCGTVKSETGTDLPVGLQIIGNKFDEETILQVAHAFEQSNIER